MATLAQLEAALRAADAAGNTEDARRLAEAYAAARAQPTESTADRYARLQREAAALPQADGTGSDGENFLAGIGKSFVDTGRGLKQAGTDAARFFVESNPVIFGEHGADGLKAKGRQQQAEEAERRRRDAPLMDTKAGLAGNIAGTGAQIIGPGILLRGTAGAALALPRTIAGNAAQGGAIGLVQPVTHDSERAGNVALGTAFGTVGAGAPKLATVAARGVKNAALAHTARGAERDAVRVIQQEASNAGRLLTPNPSAVPGATRSLFEETLDPGVARLETRSRGTGGGWAERDSANNAARSRVVENIAGDDAAMAAAKAARDTAANPLRRAALQIEGVDSNRLLSQIKRLEKMHEGRPAVQGALGQIRGLLTRTVPDAERTKAAIQPLQEFIASDRTSATNRDAAKAAIAQIRSGEWPTGTFGSGASGTVGVGASSDAARAALAQARKALEKTHVGHDKVAVMYNVRKTIGDMLAGKYGGDSAAALAGSRELMAVKNQLDRVLEKQAPEFGQYLDAFKAGSKPINRMEVGQTLLDSGSGAIVDPATGAYRLTPGVFGRQVKNLDAVAQRATGFGKAKAADILTPADLAGVHAVNDDLARQAQRLLVGSGGGSHTMSQADLGKRVIARSLIRVIPGFRTASEYLEEAGAKRLNGALEEVLSDPNKYRAIALHLSKSDRRLLEQSLLRIGGTTGAALTPALAE